MRVLLPFVALFSLACASGNGHPASPSGRGAGAGAGGASAGSGNGGTAGSSGSAGAVAALPVCPDPIDLGVHLVGRHDGCDETGVRMAWSGTGFVARFSGTGLSISQSGAAVQYTVVVDGAVGPNLLTTRGSGTYEVVTGLADGEHTVEVYRRGEASFGVTILQGVDVVDGELLSPPAAPARRIEVIGDSITCGYGNEGEDTSCSFSADTENHYLTYGAVLARALDAELSTIAWSGRGVVVNYDGDTASPTMPAYFERAIPQDSSTAWFFPWEPDAVIVNLGTNDYSTNNDPEDTVFVDGYETLLLNIRQRYPAAYVLCTVGPLLSGADLSTARTNIAAAVAGRNDAGDDRVAAYELAPNNPDPGCDWHPSVATHAAMADELAVPLAQALGW